jgi:hypothetical protein
MTTEEYRVAFRSFSESGLYRYIEPCTGEVQTASSVTALANSQVNNIPPIPSPVNATEYNPDNTYIQILITHKL